MPPVPTSFAAIQQEQQRESLNTSSDPDFQPDLSSEQFQQVLQAITSEGLAEVAEIQEDLSRIDALLPMRQPAQQVNTSVNEPRVFFSTHDKESIVIYHQTGTALDEIIKLVVREVNCWISSEGIASLNRRRVADAIARRISAPAPLAPGKLKLFVKAAPEGDVVSPTLKSELEDITKDLYLWIGREDQKCKLGANSALLKNLWKPYVIHKIETFLLKGRKDRNFSAIKTALSELRGASWVQRSNFVGNLRVIFGIINKYFFEVFFDKSYSAMQNSPMKLTPARINGELGFKSHNVEVLARCLTSEEKLILDPWLNSDKAKNLRLLTKQVFSEYKFKLLQDLQVASNLWDKDVSKAVIKILYLRNRERSTLQTREREQAQKNRRGPASSAKPDVRQITYVEVRKSFIDKKDYLPICTPLLEMCYKTPDLDFERALSFGKRAIEYVPNSDLWMPNPEVISKDEPLFKTYPTLEKTFLNVFGISDEEIRTRTDDLLAEDREEVPPETSEQAEASSRARLERSSAPSIAARQRNYDLHRRGGGSFRGGRS
jgi:hypothetical protein